MVDTSTREGREKRQLQLDREDYNRLCSLYHKYRKTNPEKAYNISKILFEKYGEGDFKSGSDYGNTVDNNK